MQFINNRQKRILKITCIDIEDLEKAIERTYDIKGFEFIDIDFGHNNRSMNKVPHSTIHDKETRQRTIDDMRTGFIRGHRIGWVLHVLFIDGYLKAGEYALQSGKRRKESIRKFNETRHP